MTTLNKSKVTIINWGLTTLFIVICLLLSLTQIQETYAEMQKVSATSKRVANLFSSESSNMQATVRFVVDTASIYSSSDPDWDKAKIFSAWHTINPTDQGEDFKGCYAITHPNGDQTFLHYDGSWKWVLPRDGNKWTSEEYGYFTGGTGKFNGITGFFTGKGKGDGPTDATVELQFEYEVK